MLNFRRPHDVALAALVVVVPVIGFGCFLLYKEQRSVSDTITQMHNANFELAKQIDIPTQIVEKVVSKTVVWRPIQEQVKDTVVQVFAQVAEFDFLQPYRTPQQYSMCGRGFFINDQGDLITNAHVINQARSVWIQIPSLGRRIIDVEVIGMTPDRDIALLRVKPAGLEIIISALG